MIYKTSISVILLVLLPTALAANTACHRSIDLVFLIDGSNSVGEANFILTLSTVVNAVSSLVVGVSDTHVGAVLYSTRVDDYLPLQTDVEAFRKGVLQFTYPDQSTATDLGIDKAMQILLSSSRNVSKILIIITDGESDKTNLTKLKADFAKAQGINIWSIGVTKAVNIYELTDMATNGLQQTFLLRDYQQLAEELQDLTTIACLPTVCHQTMDLMFVVDGSNSVGPENFELMMNTMVQALNILTIGQNDSRVGAVVYSTNVTSISLQSDVRSFTQGVHSFMYPDEETATDKGIQEAVSILMSQRREGVPMTMIIITDGESNDTYKAKLQADAAKLQDIDIWCIGVTDAVSLQELAQLATNGLNQSFAIKDFQLLSQKLPSLTSMVCDRIIPPPDPVCHRQMDMVFVIDGSNSVGKFNFDTTLDTVAKAVGNIIIGFNDTRVGAVVYSSGVTSYLNLQTDVNKFKTDVKMFSFPDETSAADLGIIRAVDILTNNQRNVPKTMIIITDGASDDIGKTQVEAQTARKKGITIWGIGVGIAADMDELKALASSKDQIFPLENYAQLSTELERLTTKICQVCKQALDLVFVIDGSNSIGENIFNSALDTVAKAVDSLLVGDLNVRVGAVLYSDNVAGVVDLQSDEMQFRLGFNLSDTNYDKKWCLGVKAFAIIISQ